MTDKSSNEKWAQVNASCRKDSYRTWIGWAILGAVGPISRCVAYVLLKAPGPESSKYIRTEKEPAPFGDSYDVYDHEWASEFDLVQTLLGFFVGVIVTIAFVLLLYCIARFIADPIMYRIDIRFEVGSWKSDWLKRIIMLIIVLMYCGAIIISFVLAPL